MTFVFPEDDLPKQPLNLESVLTSTVIPAKFSGQHTAPLRVPDGDGDELNSSDVKASSSERKSVRMGSL